MRDDIGCFRQVATPNTTSINNLLVNDSLLEKGKSKTLRMFRRIVGAIVKIYYKKKKDVMF